MVHSDLRPKNASFESEGVDVRSNVDFSHSKMINLARPMGWGQINIVFRLVRAVFGRLGVICAFGPL